MFSMTKMMTMWKREVRAYFYTPLAYAFIGVFIVLMGLMFWRFLGDYHVMTMQSAQMKAFGQAPPTITVDRLAEAFYQNMHVILMFVLPFFTMRLFSEESRQGTIYLLMTSPVRSIEIVFAKFKAAAFIYFLMLVMSLVFPIFLQVFSSAGVDSGPDWGIVMTSYVGLYLTGLVYISIGTFWSSVFDSQMVALILSIVSSLALWLIPTSASFTNESYKFISYLSINEHFPAFLQGAIETKSVIYLLSFSLAWIYLAWQSVESRSWRT